MLTAHNLHSTLTPNDELARFWESSPMFVDPAGQKPNTLDPDLVKHDLHILSCRFTKLSRS